MQTDLTISPKQQIISGQACLKELKALVQRREDKLVIGGKQYLYFSDWQILGAFFGITAKVVETEQVFREVPSESVPTITLREPIGYKARAVAVQNGQEISAAEAECLFDEANWKGKPKFQVLSMAQTRACSKALRNCLQWIVRLPSSEFAVESAEEIQ